MLRSVVRAFALILIVLVFAAPSVAFPVYAQPDSQTKKLPFFEKAKCKFDTSGSSSVTCGFVTVPENRRDPKSQRTVRLHLAIFKARNGKAAPDPIIYLDGGPGGHTLVGAVGAYKYAFEEFGQRRDFIMFDQRGVGFSEPSLDCPEYVEAVFDTLNLRINSQEKEYTRDRALAACHDRLVRSGINLGAFNTRENAADVNDIMLALGYKKYNLYGISYGTRLALTVMRDFPENVRSALIDSVVPLQADLYAKMPANADKAFTVFFQGCLKNLRCNTAYPNLDKTFTALVQKLNQNPVIITVKQPYTGKKFKMLMDGDIFIHMLFSSMYSRTVVWLPKAITEAYNGDFEFLTEYMRGATIQESYFSDGMYFSVQCSEELAFNTVQSLADADKNFPKLSRAFDMSRYYNICQMWNVPPADPVENKAVSSKIPTLVISGAYDPITPPSYGYLASQTLTRSFIFQFPGVGHGASLGDTCPYELSIRFFDEPTTRPNIGCMSSMQEPEFITPFNYDD